MIMTIQKEAYQKLKTPHFTSHKFDMKWSRNSGKEDLFMLLPFEYVLKIFNISLLDYNINILNILSVWICYY